MTSLEFRNDPMFLRNHFKGDGTFEMPKIKKEEVDLENIELVGYDKLSSSKDNQIVHFFLDDYKFEVMWNDPLPRVEKLKSHKAVLTPNFSVYTEMPIPMKIYNTFRSRWCGAYLQQNGIKVIPTIAWGGPETFWFCFDGIETKSVVAVSTLGVRNEKDLFMQGYNEMLRRIKPEKIICYGESFSEMKGNIIEVDYAKTNNLDKSFDFSGGYIKRSVGYVIPYVEKGMGSAGGNGKITWKPKKPDDERFLGKPGEIKITFDKNGERRLTKIGDDGRCTIERHESFHRREDKHTNPHDHMITWDTNSGNPKLESPVNYLDGAPKFKLYKGEEKYMSENIVDNMEDRFESISDFVQCMNCGGEVEFVFNGKCYSITHPEGRINVGEGYYIKDGKHYNALSHDECVDVEGLWGDTADEILEYSIDGERLHDIITQVEIICRTI